MAVNTTDGSALWDFAFDLQLLTTGDPVRQANEAHAYASCMACVTGAVAFQVLLIVGQADEIIPLNAAVAANYECVSCQTYAFAFQLVASLVEVPSAEIQQELDAVMKRLQDLDVNAGSLTPEEILLALTQAKRDILLALAPILAVETGTTDVEQAGAEPDERGEVAPPSDEPSSSDAPVDEREDDGPEQMSDEGNGNEADAEKPADEAEPDQGLTEGQEPEKGAKEPTGEADPEGGDSDGVAEEGSSDQKTTEPEECPPEEEEDAAAEDCPARAESAAGDEALEEPAAAP